MQTYNYNTMSKAVTCFVVVALVFVLGSGAALAQPDQDKQVYLGPGGGWILYYNDANVNTFHDPGETWSPTSPPATWRPDNSCWMASASNLLVNEGFANPYLGLLGPGGASSPSSRPWAGQVTAGGGGAFMTFDDGGWQHWALDHVGVPRQGPIITTSEFTPGTWAIDPVAWCQARLAEGHLCGLTVYWGTPAPNDVPGRVDPYEPTPSGYHSITLVGIDVNSPSDGTVTITDSDDMINGPQVRNYTWEGADWVIKNLYPLYPDPNAHVNYAVALKSAFTYQGRLIDANDAADGLYDFQFKLFDDPNVVIGNQVDGDVNKPEVDVIDGYFTVELDFGNIFNGAVRWLEIGVRDYDACDVNAFTTLSPRQEVTPTPYAFYAQTAGSDGDWTVVGNDMYSIPSGNVGIGTTSPDKKLTVEGSIRGSTSYACRAAVYGKNSYSGSTMCIWPAITCGGFFEVGRGSGVVGYASVGGDGVYGRSDGSSGKGVYGYAIGSSGKGVYGYASGGSSTGVYGWGNQYDFYAAGPGTDYGTASSIRWKSDIRQIDAPLDKVMSLRGVYFNWDAEHGGEHDVGMIAEEVGEVLPEIVEYEADSKYTSGMDYGKLTPLLVEAVKALKTEKDDEIAELKGQLSQMELLQKENAELQERIAALESIVAKASQLRKGGTQ